MQATTLVFLLLNFFGKSVANEGNFKKEYQLLYVLETDNVTEIIKSIFIGYDKNQRPYHKVKPLNIAVSLGVNSVSHISEENMEFQADVYFRQYWHEPRLAYGKDNTSIILQGDAIDKMWLPDTYIANARTSSVEKRTRTAILTANGSIFYTFKSTYIVLSEMNFLNYPMDEQILKVQIYSYAYDSDKILLEWKSGLFLNTELAGFISEQVIMNEEKYKFITGTFSSLSFQFKIRRRLGYFILQFYFPCILCAVVSWLPFWMDRYEIGDRMSLGITTLLTAMFLSQYINSAMPQVSYIKAADEFLLASFIFILLALMESVLVYNVRGDVRTKNMKQRQMSRREDKRQEIFVKEDCPYTITDVFQEGFKMTDVQPEKTQNHSDQQPKIVQSKARDLGHGVDKLSRIIFPTSYVLFVAYYFGRYLLF
ncbi:gamma-aminobutyric acid receptor subunit beta-3-like [Actinia tenebrosa]|uniref:Gamma-aminobutyric acid receptor subunit beta-3-like n=1 Tax=Actinia tenebrosa TaxID=6105 RepID=A0A6P8JAT6_ACTTE|nr:gamma-aminobutyric acid receptor subunit beta-3-like [Actinia tenebrosa]